MRRKRYQFVVKRSRRPYYFKTGHFTSRTERERLRNVQKSVKIARVKRAKLIVKYANLRSSRCLGRRCRELGSFSNDDSNGKKNVT